MTRSNGETPQVTRRNLLRLTITGLVGVFALDKVSRRPVEAESNDSSDPAIIEIRLLNQRIKSGDVTVLANGLYLIDGWCLPPNYVQTISVLSDSL